VNLNRPLFRTDRLFRWDRRFLKGQHLHLFPVVLDYRMVRLFPKVRRLLMLPVIRYHQRFRKVPLLLMGQHLH
jgi:hypothetical protein